MKVILIVHYFNGETSSCGPFISSVHINWFWLYTFKVKNLKMKENQLCKQPSAITELI